MSRIAHWGAIRPSRRRSRTTRRSRPAVDGTGIEVSGANASATITGNNIYDNTTGIDVSSGSAGIAGNDVYGNTTTGILLDQPGAGTAFTANTVSGNGTGISLDGAGATGITIDQKPSRTASSPGSI